MKSKEKATIIAALIGGIFVCAAAVIGLGLPFVELWVDQHLRAVTPIITPTQPVALTSAPISTDEHSSSSQPYPSAVPAVSPSPSYTKTPIIAATTSIVPTPTPSWTVTSTRERVETWVQVGLPNEAISDLIIANNGVYYAATKGYHHGIFKSVDRGITWTAINNGLGNLEVGGIDVSDVIPDHIVAATEGGLWLTNDGGAHWQLCDSIPYRDESFVDVSFVPGDASKIVAVGVANYGAFITYDAGRTWSGTYDHWRNMSFLQVCISAKPTPLIYLFSYVAGYRSNDLGKSWNGIANVGANYYVPRVAVDPTNASITAQSCACELTEKQ
jgi:hypothetical protein